MVNYPHNQLVNQQVKSLVPPIHEDEKFFRFVDVVDYDVNYPFRQYFCPFKNCRCCWITPGSEEKQRDKIIDHMRRYPSHDEPFFPSLKELRETFSGERVLPERKEEILFFSSTH